MGKHPLVERAEHVLEAYLTDLKAIVNIDSGTYTREGVNLVGAYLQKRFHDFSFATYFEPQQEYGDNLVAVHKGVQADGPCILLIGHIDTVFPENEAMRRPFTIREQGGRRIATGPGVFDMKAGVLIGIYGLHLLIAAEQANYQSVTFICNSDEEIGSIASKPLIQELAGQSDAVLVLEPGRTVNGIVTARRGSGRYRLDVYGVAAHAGANLEQGRNAILEISYQVQALQALNGTIPGTSISVGIIQGGERENIVPDHAYCLFDVRAGDEAGIRSMEAALRQIAEHPVLDGTSMKLSGGMRRMPYERTEGNARLARLAKEAGKELGLALEEFEGGGASDANHTSILGVPSLDGLGVAGGLAHNAGEYIELDSVVPRMALLANLVRTIGDYYQQGDHL